jgi:hypothetical protein
LWLLLSGFQNLVFIHLHHLASALLGSQSTFHQLRMYLPYLSGTIFDPMNRIGYDGNPTYSSEPESDKPTSTQPTSTSSCTTVTASKCTDFVSYGVDTAGSTTATATSSVCSTVTACSASAFTTTTFTTASCTVSSSCSTVTSCPALFGRHVKRQACATSSACSPTSTGCPGATTNYIVYPTNQDAVGLISDTLSNDFKIDQNVILTSESQYLGFNYWEIPLTQAQFNSLNGNSLVRYKETFTSHQI